MVKKTCDHSYIDLFLEDSQIFFPIDPLAYQVTIELTNPQLSDTIGVDITIPSDYRESVPQDDEIEAYAMTLQETKPWRKYYFEESSRW